MTMNEFMTVANWGVIGFLILAIFAVLFILIWFFIEEGRMIEEEQAASRQRRLERLKKRNHLL